MFDLQQYLNEKTRLINKALARTLPAETTRPAILQKAMRYSVLAGGKRLRPILCLAAAEAVGGNEKSALPAAVAIELLHTYTLIHDDLPCMDDDKLRRGKPTCHIVFGEANAILAGDALLTLAFKLMAETRPRAPYTAASLVLELATAAGSLGVIGGQVEDLASEEKEPNAATVSFIHLHKTAALIKAAVRIGAMCAGAGKRELDTLSIYGAKAGLAFQIVDDILNETSTPEQLGKAAGSDRQRGKMTYVKVHGLKAAEKTASRLAEEAKGTLARLKGNTAPLKAIVKYIVARNR
jgi:geranylgeranyl diphosphate synthase type II